MKNYLRFLSPVMLLLMAVMFGGGKIYAKDVTATQTSFTATKADNIGGDKNLSYSTAQGGGTVAPKVVNNVIQLYQNSNGKAGGTITIKSIDGVVIKSVTIGSSMKTSVAYTIDNSTTKSANSSLNENGKYTVPNLTASSITFYCMGADKKSRLYVNYLSVTYSIEGSNKTPTTLSFANSETSFTYDLNSNDGIAELVNPATLSPNVEGATISYAISESTFADGEISVDNGTVIFSTDKEASATITASYAGDDTYTASSASYTIKVVKPATVEDGVFDFSTDFDYGSGVTKTEDGNYYVKTDKTWTAGNVKMVTSGKYRWWKASNGLRFYKGSKFTLSVPDGYLITNVALAGTYAFTVDCGNFSNGKWFGAASSIVFNLKENGSGNDVDKITVKYIKTETLTTSVGGYATYSADYAVNYSELGLTAYTLTVDETNKTVTAKEFTGVVPAGKAVLVKGTASTTYTLIPATTEGDATFATDLQTGATTADGTQYGFTSKSGTPAFAQVVSGEDIPAKKGYIVLKGASAAKYSICFDDEATGIHTIEAASAANDAMYNLAGQRVDKAYKGIVIVNGKKYLNK